MSDNLPYHEQEKLLADAIKYKQQHPTASYRFLQRHFGVHKDKICQRFNGWQQSRCAHEPSNKRLNPEQDKALCWFLDFLNEFGIPLRYKTLAASANHILLHDDPNAKPVSKNWSGHWCTSHPEYKIVKEKPIEQARQQTMNAVTIQQFFRKLEDIMKEHNIEKEDFWNMDETGVRIGVGRRQWVIVPDNNDEKGRFTNIIGSHGDQEHVTVVEAISAGGVVIPPLIIIKGKVILHRWFADILDDDYLIGVSDSGYANDVLFFQWLQHWETMSKRTKKGEYRLLLLDGYDSHLTWTSLQFCREQKVVVVTATYNPLHAAP